MQDHAARISAIVKDELARQCAALGIDKNEAGWALGGFGALNLVEITDDKGQSNYMPIPIWTIMLSLRSLQLVKNSPPAAASFPVAGVLPTDEAFREVVRELLPKVDEKRRADLLGAEQTPSGFTPRPAPVMQ